MLMWDEGGLLIPEHIPVEQKISTTGQLDDIHVSCQS